VKLSKSLVLAVSSSLALAALASAQPASSGAPPFNYVAITTLTVKPAAVPEFESYVKKINAAAAKIGVRPANIYMMGRGGPGFTYVATVRYAKWAEMDERPSVPDILNKAYGEVEGTKIQNAGRSTIESISSEVLHVLADLSVAPSFEPPPAHVRVTRIAAKVGSTSRFEAYLAKVKAAQAKVGGSLPVIRYTTALGPGNQYVASYFFNKFAELDSAPGLPEVLRKAYGETEARLLEEQAQSSIDSLELHVLDYRLDLSRPTAAK